MVGNPERAAGKSNGTHPSYCSGNFLCGLRSRLTTPKPSVFDPNAHAVFFLVHDSVELKDAPHANNEVGGNPAFPT
jgi:hypothetical protein